MSAKGFISAGVLCFVVEVLILVSVSFRNNCWSRVCWRWSEIVSTILQTEGSTELKIPCSQNVKSIKWIRSLVLMPILFFR